MKLKAIICPNCKDIIYSRALHDLHRCSCKSLYVDGGLDYLRYGGLANAFENTEITEIELDTTKKELFDDWNKGVNKFGVIVTDIKLIE